MTANSKFKRLLAIAVLSSFSSFTAASAEENNDQAPEATAADAKLSFWDIPALEKAFIDTAPAAREDAIPVGELGVDGGEKASIVKLAEEIADKKHGDYDSLLIAHKGKLLFESYYLKGRINLPHAQASAVKAYTSLIVGRAIQLGYLSMDDLEKPLISFLKDLGPTKFVEGAEKITLHKALTMSSGIRISEDARKEIEKNPARLKGQGEMQLWLEHSEPITSESQIFKYQDDPKLVMQVIDAVVPGTAEDFIKNEMLDKMGIANYRWRNGPSGLPEAGWRVEMTSRDMLKWGSLVANKGKWQGEQLISAAYLDKATSGIADPTLDLDWIPDFYSYGYFWYQANVAVDDKIYDAKIAWGGGGQQIIVVPEHDLIIVITGHDEEDNILTQVAEAVLPAFDE